MIVSGRGAAVLMGMLGRCSELQLGGCSAAMVIGTA